MLMWLGSGMGPLLGLQMTFFSLSLQGREREGSDLISSSYKNPMKYVLVRTLLHADDGSPVQFDLKCQHTTENPLFILALKLLDPSASTKLSGITYPSIYRYDR